MNIERYDQSTALVLKVAYLYYMRDKCVNAIAEELGVSATTVSRLLKKARQDKIIEFVIRDPYVDCILMEQELKKAFGLQDVIVAPAISENLEAKEHEVKKLVALEAARYLQRIIKKDDILGITWGSTVYEMINYLNPSQKVDATFVTLHGSLASCQTEWDVWTLVTRIAKAFSGRKYILLADAIMESKKTVDQLMCEKKIAQVFQIFEKVNISVNGIGSFYPKINTILARPEFLPAKNLLQLKEKHAAGDIALRFFDKDGRECDTDLKSQALSIGFETFKRIPRKITIASEAFKAHTVFYALKAGLINVLITDNQLASEILRIYREEQKVGP